MDRKERKQPEIIGGVFGLLDPLGLRSCYEQFDFLSGSNLFLANARSAIQLLFLRLKPARIWFPSYLCPVLLSGIFKNSPIVSFFPVGANLQPIVDTGWLDTIAKGDIVVLIDYFGFLSNDHVAQHVRDRGGWVVEDACQAMLSTSRLKNADFVVVSPRKFVGIPDGAVLISRCGITFEEYPLEQLPFKWWSVAFEAVRSRAIRDVNKSDSRDWYVLFRQSEQNMPIGDYAMSHLSRYLLSSTIRFSDIQIKRRDNYIYLLSQLQELAIFPEIDDCTVPLGFPIHIEQRDYIQQHLFSENIYPPIHWDISGVVPGRFEDSLLLSKKILTLPCDQRYGKADMNRMVVALKRAMKLG